MTARADSLTPPWVTRARVAASVWPHVSGKRLFSGHRFLAAKAGSLEFALCQETLSGNLVSGKRCCATLTCRVIYSAAFWS